MNAPIQILLKSSVVYILPNFMSHDWDVIREFAKKHLSGKINVAYIFEMKVEVHEMEKQFYHKYWER